MSIATSLLFKICEENKTNYFLKLKKEWFIDIESDIYNFMYDFYKSYHKMPSAGVFFEKFNISKVSEPFEYYADTFRKNTTMRYLSELASKINNLNMDNNNADLILENIISFMNTSTKLKTILDTDIKSYTDLMIDVKDLLENKMFFGTGISTGWETLDNETGGLQKGNVFVVLARVKMGKSAVLLHMANTALNLNKKVMIVSMEMTAREMGLRLIAMRKHYNLKYIHRNRPSSFLLNKIKEEIDNNTINNLWFVEGQFKKGINSIIGSVKTYLPDIVYIDGGYLIKPSESTKNKAKWEVISDVIEEIKTLAMVQDIPIVVSFQFNRQVNRASKTIENIAFEKIQLSDAISQIVSTGIALLQKENRDDERLIEIIGGRGGEQGVFTIKWDWETMNFEEITY